MSTATAQKHEPWCRDHHHNAAGIGIDEADWCQNTVLDVWRPQDTGAWMKVTIDGPTAWETRSAAIDVYVECQLSASEARQLAAALVEAAALLEAGQAQR